jgi:hypothetical protein
MIRSCLEVSTAPNSQRHWPWRRGWHLDAGRSLRELLRVSMTFPPPCDLLIEKNPTFASTNPANSRNLLVYCFETMQSIKMLYPVSSQWC